MAKRTYSGELQYLESHKARASDNSMSVTEFLDEVKRVEELVAFVESESGGDETECNEKAWDPSVMKDYDEKNGTPYMKDKDEVVQSFLESISKYGKKVIDMYIGCWHTVSNCFFAREIRSAIRAGEKSVS